jgi:hypothetical protein
MADFSFTPAAAGIKLAPQTSLADMIGVARGAQAYQQAQQVNPIELQRAQTELQRLQALTPLEIERAGAETRVSTGTERPRIESAVSAAETARLQSLTAQYGLDKTQSADAHQIIGGYVGDSRLTPESIKTNPTGPVEVMHEIRTRLKTLGIPDKKIDVFTAAGMNKALSDPDSFPQAFTGYLQNVQTAGMAPAQQRGLTLPEAVSGAAGQPPMIRDPLTGALRPAPIINVPAGASTAPVAQPQAVTPAQMGQPPVEEFSKPEQLPYAPRPIGSTTIAPLSPSEGDAVANGNAYRQGLIANQTNLTTSRRNVDEVIKTAKEIEKSELPTTGILGGARRKVAGWLGDPTYIQLSKDLANTAIANIKAMGGSIDTVAGQQLTRMANGDETYPPKVLINIANRAKSDMTNLDMQATAAQKFAIKYGDNNMNAFKQMWSKNADSKIFEAMNIANETSDPAERKKALDELIPKDEKSRQVYLQKYRNIKRLTETGGL